jgi:hypothetical protein
MSVTYSPTAIDYRLNGVISAIDSGGGNGSLVLRADSTVISTISLSLPCGTVSGGILTFTGTLLDPSAVATGIVNNAQIRNSAGVVMISDLSIGIPGQTADVIMFNGLSNTLISSGQAVQVLAAQVTGS